MVSSRLGRARFWNTHKQAASLFLRSTGPRGLCLLVPGPPFEPWRWWLSPCTGAFFFALGSAEHNWTYTGIGRVDNTRRTNLPYLFQFHEADDAS